MSDMDMSNIRGELGLSPEEMREEIHQKCHLIGGLLLGMALAFAQENLGPEKLACGAVDAVHMLAGAFLIADVLDLESDLVDHLEIFVKSKIGAAIEEMASRMSHDGPMDEMWPDLVDDR